MRRQSSDMSDAPAIASPAKPSRTPALVVWLAVQLAALALAAGRVPLWPDFPKPGDQFAAEEMAVAHIVVACLLFPWLMRTPSLAFMVIASTWPFAYLAGLLSAHMEPAMIRVGLFTTGWMIGLALWRSSLRSRRERAIGIALATLLSLGGVVLWYVSRGRFRPFDARADALFSPILSAIAVMDVGTLRKPWGALVTWDILALAAAVVAGRSARRRATRPS